MNENLKVLNRLRQSLTDSSTIKFLNNYAIQNNLPFNKDRHGLLTVYPELKKFSETYFSLPSDLLENSNRVRAYIIGGFEWLEDTISYPEKKDFTDFNKKFNETTIPVINFYDGLSCLAKVYAHHKDVSILKILDDEKSMREIHQKISTPEKFRDMEEKRWELCISLLKVLPEIEGTYTDFFNELATESAEVMQVTAGYANRFNKNVEFFHPKIQDIAETLIKSKKINFSELEEGLGFFKKYYHDKIVKHSLISYF